MRKAAICFIGICVLLLSLATQAKDGFFPKKYQGRVVWVNDGDTLEVRTSLRRKVRIRLAAIDAPEKEQDFGKLSREALMSIALHKDARLECVKKKDQYKRDICKVFVVPKSCPDCGQTLDAGLAMLTLGLAWWYQPLASIQSPQDQGAYSFAEQEAKAKKAGLWRSIDPIPPWKWRKNNQKAKKSRL